MSKKPENACHSSCWCRTHSLIEEKDRGRGLNVNCVNANAYESFQYEMKKKEIQNRKK